MKRAQLTVKFLVEVPDDVPVEGLTLYIHKSYPNIGVDDGANGVIVREANILEHDTVKAEKADE